MNKAFKILKVKVIAYPVLLYLISFVYTCTFLYVLHSSIYPMDYENLQIEAIVGGLAMARQQRVLKKCPDILVATPGRLWELVQQVIYTM